MNLDSQIRAAIQQAVTALFGESVAPLQIQPTNAEFEGSHTLVCFPLAKISKKGPEETARVIGEYLVAHSWMVSRFNVVKGFLNLVITDDVWVNVFRDIYADKNFGLAAPNGHEIMVEYSSPNTNKPLHLGHLRNNFLGYSVAEIYKALGYGVHKVQIINDRGIHICKSMAAWQLFGNGETPESSGLKGDHLVGKYYVIFEAKSIEQFTEILFQEGFERNIDKSQEPGLDFAHLIDAMIKTKQDVGFLQAAARDLEAKIHIKREQFSETQLDVLSCVISRLSTLVNSDELLIIKAQELLRKWEAKDNETIRLWKTMNGWVYEGFASTYARMGVDFDKLYFESETYLLGKEEVMRGLAQGVFFKKEDGSVWVDLTSDGLDQKVLLRADGTSVYMTQDIGTAILRFREFPKIEGQVYTVGNEQEYHFKVLFLILKKLGYAWAEKCYHLSYGMVDLPTGKMKSREGTVVDADDLMQEMVEEAEQQTRTLGKIDGATDAEIAALSEQIGLGALKFFLLKVDPKKRMMFDPAESIQLQGHTGPFIQYTHARIRAIVRKASALGIAPEEGFDVATLEPAERQVVFLLASYPARLSEAARTYSPAVVANFAFDLAKEYNQFYQSIPIFSEGDAGKLKFRIAFSITVADVLRKAMRLLGIDVPERM